VPVIVGNGVFVGTGVFVGVGVDVPIAVNMRGSNPAPKTVC
jgi:hypothetical protein